MMRSINVRQQTLPRFNQSKSFIIDGLSRANGVYIYDENYGAITHYVYA